jgi:hypothetical protein
MRLQLPSPLSPRQRMEIENEIERLIALLDAR